MWMRWRNTRKKDLLYPICEHLLSFVNSDGIISKFYCCHAVGIQTNTNGNCIRQAMQLTHVILKTSFLLLKRIVFGKYTISQDCFFLRQNFQIEKVKPIYCTVRKSWRTLSFAEIRKSPGFVHTIQLVYHFSCFCNAPPPPPANRCMHCVELIIVIFQICNFQTCIHIYIISARFAGVKETFMKNWNGAWEETYLKST